MCVYVCVCVTDGLPVPFDKLKRCVSLSHIWAAPVNLQLRCGKGDGQLSSVF